MPIVIFLSQNYYRDYAPNLDRYIEMNPIKMRERINNFFYAANNPILSFDDLGLKYTKEECILLAN